MPAAMSAPVAVGMPLNVGLKLGSAVAKTNVEPPPAALPVTSKPLPSSSVRSPQTDTTNSYCGTAPRSCVKSSSVTTI